MSLKTIASKASLALVLAVSAVASQAATMNLVQNGNFENTGGVTVNPGSFLIFNAGTGNNQTTALLPNWSASNGIEVRNNLAGQAQSPSNFVELDTTRNSSIWQVITTTVGQVYELTFFFSPRPGVSTPTGTNAINAYWGNSLAIRDLSAGGTRLGSNPTADGSGANATDNKWIAYSFLVVGSGSDLLRFAAAGASDSFGGSLDSISLVATPLPGAALLFGTALAGFFGFSNRRKV